ncbi:MAG: WbqC family protein [Elusimicrobia bacterium]|nr:WbqC family protein [Elusimicrobiota bacterium]
MIVAAHQPNFIPWLGYFDKMRKADLFIIVDHVQMERQSYQNRVRIKTGAGERWITVPVVQESRAERIVDKRIDNSRLGRFRWSRKMFLTLKYAYQSAPHFRDYEPALEEIFSARWDRLSELNLRLILFCRQALGISTPLRISSDMRVQGARSDMVLNMCRAAGADVYLAGHGASREYLDVSAFERAGIRVAWQDFEHPRYRQYPACDRFIPNLSSLDLIFNCGPGSGQVLRGASLRAGAAA